MTKGQSKPVAGLKSRVKANAHPSKAVKPKESVAEKGKGAFLSLTEESVVGEAAT